MRLEDLAERPLPTSTVDDVRAFAIEADSAYLFRASDNEPRSLHARDLRDRTQQATFVEIVEQTSEAFRYRRAGGTDREVPLHAPQQLAAFWEELGHTRCYVDMTAMQLSVSAALVKSAIETRRSLAVVYVEPAVYRPNRIDDPSGEAFRLSRPSDGLAPLPGFLTLQAPPAAQQWFVPLLGFEGRRYAYTRDRADPAPGQTIPVVGIPGYRPEFVAYAYHGNEQMLHRDNAWQRVRYAPANCPFSLYHVLSDLLVEHADGFLRVAPIGTKPHALGAVLFALMNRDRVEILYDHPVTNPDRTSGQSRLLTYEVSLFAELVEQPRADAP